MQNKIIDFIERNLTPIANKFEKQRHISAIRDGLIASIPLTIIGGFSLLISSPPVDSEVMHPTNFFFKGLLKWDSWAVNNAESIMTPFHMTMGIMSIFVAIATAYSLAKYYEKEIDMAPLPSGIIAGVVFLIVSAPISDGSIPVSYLDANGLFTALIIGVLTVEISRFLVTKGFEIKMPEGVPEAIAQTFSSLIPMIVNVILFHLLNTMFINYFDASIPAVILNLLSPIRSIGDSLPAYLLIVLVIHLLWFVGLHGDSMVGGIIVPLFITNIASNAAAKAAGEAMQYTWTEPVSAFLVFMGGTGATLGLVFLLLKSDSKQLKTVGRVGLLPSLFGINEPILFGAPLILNPIMVIPFFLAPIVNALIAYFTINTGLINRSFLSVPWTSPPPIGIALSTVDIKALFLALFIILLDMAIYYPFFKAYEKQLVEQENVENGKVHV